MGTSSDINYYLGTLDAQLQWVASLFSCVAKWNVFRYKPMS